VLAHVRATVSDFPGYAGNRQNLSSARAKTRNVQLLFGGTNRNECLSLPYLVAGMTISLPGYERFRCCKTGLKEARLGIRYRTPSLGVLSCSAGND